MKLSHSILCLIALLCGALTGCYAHQGSPLDLPPSELLKEGLAACQRHDHMAYETLLKRAARDFPDSREAQRSKELLAESHTCVGDDIPSQQ